MFLQFNNVFTCFIILIIVFNQAFHKNYDFVNKMKENEVKKLKEELQEETQPKRIEKIKYLIQRMVIFRERIIIWLYAILHFINCKPQENQIRAEKTRKLEEEKQEEEKRITIEALREGKSPYFATKGNYLIAFIINRTNNLIVVYPIFSGA